MRNVPFYLDDLHGSITRSLACSYMVLVKSGPHPEAYVYKHFLTRIAPQEYKTSSTEEYGRHFTVMTFTDLPLLGARPPSPLQAGVRSRFGCLC